MKEIKKNFYGYKVVIDMEDGTSRCDIYHRDDYLNLDVVVGLPANSETVYDNGKGLHLTGEQACEIVGWASANGW